MENGRKVAEPDRTNDDDLGLETYGPNTFEVQGAVDRALIAEAIRFHRDLFPEEYDFLYDSEADAHVRIEGHNPKPSEYQEKVNSRREKLSAQPLAENGMASSNATFIFVCRLLIDGNQIPLKNLIEAAGLHRSVH
jgi:hypothetical protein